MCGSCLHVYNVWTQTLLLETRTTLTFLTFAYLNYLNVLTQAHRTTGRCSLLQPQVCGFKSCYPFFLKCNLIVLVVALRFNIFLIICDYFLSIHMWLCDRMGRDISYDCWSCDLLCAASSPDLYRINLEQVLLQIFLSYFLFLDMPTDSGYWSVTSPLKW